jgi:SAM-dependent methyltransferase
MGSPGAVTVDPSNADALRAWDGDDGAYWAAHEAVFEGSLERYQPHFLGAAAVGSDDEVLDVGCGNGRTTRAAARAAVGGSVLGIDLSGQMLEQARRRAMEAGLHNVRFLQADAQIHPFDPGRYNLAMSRTGAMFFGEPVAAFANIGRAVRPGGRLVLLVWQSLERNRWVTDIRTALAAGRDLPTPPVGAPGPFSLAEADHVRGILSDAGWFAVAVEGVEEPMWFGESADTAYRFIRGLGFTEFLLQGLDEDARARALADLRATVEGRATATGVLFPSAAWLVTATRS